MSIDQPGHARRRLLDDVWRLAANATEQLDDVGAQLRQVREERDKLQVALKTAGRKVEDHDAARFYADKETTRLRDLVGRYQKTLARLKRAARRRR